MYSMDISINKLIEHIYIISKFKFQSFVCNFSTFLCHNYNWEKNKKVLRWYDKCIVLWK